MQNVAEYLRHSLHRNNLGVTPGKLLAITLSRCFAPMSNVVIWNEQMRIISILVLFVVFTCAGCGDDPAISDSQTEKRNSQNKTTNETEAAGGPYTTKKHAGELVYVAPDGTEEIAHLGDDTIAHIKITFHEGQPDELKYELHYLRHRNGNDLYQLEYSWKTGENVSRESEFGPVTYNGVDETTINALEHGKFVIRPKSN